MKKILSVILSLAMLTGVLCFMPYTANAADVDDAPVASASVPNNVYIKQQESVTCTLAAATNMIRARFYLSDNDDWQNVTESSVHPVGWTNGMGLNGEFTYTYNGNSAHVSMGTVNGMAVATLKWLLDEHPEGVVIYSYSPQMHAVMVTDYVGDTFYCVDSDPGCASGRIPLASTVILGRYGSQANILANIQEYWVISNYSISPTNRRLDLGSDFYGLILHQPSWRSIGIHSLSGYWDQSDNFVQGYGTYYNMDVDGNVEVVPEKQSTYCRTLWRFKRGSNNTYTITSAVTGELLQARYLNSSYNVFASKNTANGYVTQWYFMQNGAGYSIIPEGKSNLRMDLSGNNTAEGTNIKLYENNNSDAQRFAVYQLDPSRDKLNYSISASNTLITLKTQKSIITLGGSIPYGYYWRIYRVDPDGQKHEVVNSLNTGAGLTYEFSGDYYYNKEGVYTFFAKIINPFGSDQGSVTSKCVKVTVRTSSAEGDYSYRVLDDGTAEITAYNGTDTDIVIPSSIAGRQVTSIAGLGEAAKQTVESVVIPEGVTSIYSAFVNCTALKSAHVPASAAGETNTIGGTAEAFLGCSNLENVTFGEGFSYIGYNMFGRSGISRIIIPDSVEVIGVWSFSSCYNLKEIFIPENTRVARAPKNNMYGGGDSFGALYHHHGIETIYGVPGSSAETYVAYANEEYGTNISFVDISTIPHEEVIEPGKPATCTEDGLTDRIYCSFCGKVLQEHEVIHSSGHDYQIVHGTPASYTQTGLTDGVQCTKCGDWVVRQTVISKLVSNYNLGDVVRSGKIDIRDVTAIQRHIAELKPLNDEQEYLADVNHDGVVNIDDATLLQMYLAEYYVTLS